jgi:hypothetical protein
MSRAFQVARTLRVMVMTRTLRVMVMTRTLRVMVLTRARWAMSYWIAYHPLLTRVSPQHTLLIRSPFWFRMIHKPQVRMGRMRD